MRGITEERLVEILGICGPVFAGFIEALMDECQELTPWQPIDENTPKDRTVLLLSGATAVEGSYVSFDGGFWMQHWTHDEINPTHWQELPEGPECTQP